MGSTDMDLAFQGFIHLAVVVAEHLPPNDKAKSTGMLSSLLLVEPNIDQVLAPKMTWREVPALDLAMQNYNPLPPINR